MRRDRGAGLNLLRLLDSLYAYATGTSLALGIVIVVGFVVGSAAFLAPLVVVALAIPALGLDHEPNKWLGTAFILVGFVAGIVATALALRWVYRGSRRFLAMAYPEPEPAVASAAPSPIVPAPIGRSRLRELDSRHAPPRGRMNQTDVIGPATPSEGREPPSRP